MCTYIKGGECKPEENDPQKVLICVRGLGNVPLIFVTVARSLRLIHTAWIMSQMSVVIPSDVGFFFFFLHVYDGCARWIIIIRFGSVWSRIFLYLFLKRANVSFIIIWLKSFAFFFSLIKLYLVHNALDVWMQLSISPLGSVSKVNRDPHVRPLRSTPLNGY